MNLRSKTGAFAVLAILAATPVLTGAGDPASKTRDLGWRGGDSMGFSLPARVTVTEGPTPSMVVSGPQDLVDRVYLDGDTVKLRHAWGGWDLRARDLRIAVTAPRVREIHASASADVTAPTLRGDRVELSASSSGRLRASVQASALDANASSSGKVEAAGKVDRVKFNASSSGRVDARDLIVTDAVVRVSSSGSAALAPRRSAEVWASRSGDVSLRSRPQQLTSQTSSSGRVMIEER